MNRYLWETRMRGCMSILTPTEFVVLRMLATYTNAACKWARPAMSTLAADCSVHRDTVKRSLRSLVAKGYLVVDEQGGGRNRPTAYSLVWNMPHVDEKTGHSDAPLSTDLQEHPDAPVLDHKGVHDEPERGAHGDVKGCTQMHPDQVRSGKKSGKTPVTYLSNEGEQRDDDRDSIANLPAVAPDLRPDPTIRRPEHRRAAGLHKLDAWCSQTAWHIVEQFAASRGAVIPTSERTEIAQQVDAMLRERIPAEQIAAGLVAWADSDRHYASQIPRFVAKAGLRSQQPQRPTATTDRKLAESAAQYRPEWDDDPDDSERQLR